MNASAFCLSAVLLFATSPLPARAAAVPDTMAQRLAACMHCHARVDPHGAPVNDAFFPRLAGKPAGYLERQLHNFRDGRRQYPLMTYLVDHLSDDYLADIAGYFAALPPTSMPPRPADVAPAVLERGRRLVREGDAVRHIPACVSCHGTRLTGVQPFIPGLLGLPRDYLNAQFGAWRNGVRRAHAPDCMADITRRLTPDDVSAISAWLASQPLPADPQAAPSIARPLPLACGSAPEER